MLTWHLEVKPWCKCFCDYWIFLNLSFEYSGVTHSEILTLKHHLSFLLLSGSHNIVHRCQQIIILGRTFAVILRCLQGFEVCQQIRLYMLHESDRNCTTHLCKWVLIPSSLHKLNSAPILRHCVWHGTVTVFILGTGRQVIAFTKSGPPCWTTYWTATVSLFHVTVYWAFALHMPSVCFIYLWLEIPHLTLESREMKYLLNVTH